VLMETEWVPSVLVRGRQCVPYFLRASGAGFDASRKRRIYFCVHTVSASVGLACLRTSVRYVCVCARAGRGGRRHVRAGALDAGGAAGVRQGRRDGGRGAVAGCRHQRHPHVCVVPGVCGGVSAAADPASEAAAGAARVCFCRAQSARSRPRPLARGHPHNHTRTSFMRSWAPPPPISPHLPCTTALALDAPHSLPLPCCPSPTAPNSPSAKWRSPRWSSRGAYPRC
jgi:hypothetical protein